MIMIEILALISTIVCVVLSAKENILAWPIGIISAISLIILYIPNHLYANMCLQTVFVIQCSIGWYKWGKKDDLKVTKLKKSKLYIQILIAIVLGCLYGKINLVVNPNILSTDAYLDGISTFIALLGNWYLTKKKLEAWPLFMMYNIIIAFLLASQGIFILSLLNIGLFFISLNAYITWKRILKEV